MDLDLILLLQGLLAPDSNIWILVHAPGFWSSYAVPKTTQILDWSGSNIANQHLALPNNRVC